MACYTKINIIKKSVDNNLVTPDDYNKCELDCSMVSHLGIASEYVDKYMKIALEAVDNSSYADKASEINKRFFRDFLIYNIALFEGYYEFHDISNDRGIVHFAVLKSEGKYHNNRYLVDNHKMKMIEVEFLDNLIMSLCAVFLIEYNGIYLEDYNHFELDKKNLAILSENILNYTKHYSDDAVNDITKSVLFKSMGTIVEVVDNLTYDFYSYEEEVVHVEDEYDYHMGDW